MKKLLIVILLGLAMPLLAGSRDSDVKGDDLFPWPWGTECPFPWAEISGSYILKSQTPSAYAGHYLIFEVNHEARDGLKFLNISQYDKFGRLFASGRGYSQKDQRIVKGILKSKASGREYVAMVRSYVKEKKLSCTQGQNLVTAVTFCPLRSKKCLESSYALEKL